MHAEARLPVVLFAGGPGWLVFAGNATLPLGNTPPGALMPFEAGCVPFLARRPAATCLN